MKITEIGYFGPSSNLRDTRLAALDVDQLAAAIAALPPRKPVARPAGEVVPFVRSGAK